MEKNKAMVSSCQDVKVKIQMNGKQLEEVSSFNFLGPIIPAEGSSYEEIRARHDMTRLFKADTENRQFHSNY